MRSHTPCSRSRRPGLAAAFALLPVVPLLAILPSGPAAARGAGTTAMVSAPSAAALQGTTAVLPFPLAAGTVRPGHAALLRLAGRRGVPSTAGAVLLTVTVSAAVAAGDLTLWPAGSNRPAPLLSYPAPAGGTATLVVALGKKGEVAVATTRAATVAVTVLGYTDALSVASGAPGTLQPRPATRVVDTGSALAARGVPGHRTVSLRLLLAAFLLRGSPLSWRRCPRRPPATPAPCGCGP